ncbi:MAG: hypothetical protein ACRDB9_01325 [Cetobacterium sp.]
MKIYVVNYDVENEGTGVLGVYFSEDECIKDIADQVHEKTDELSKEELINKIKQEGNYETERKLYVISEYDIPYVTYLVLCEDYENTSCNSLGMFRTFDESIKFIEKDIKEYKDSKCKKIKEGLKKYSEYSERNGKWCYKIKKEII